MTRQSSCDVLICGAGVAGLTLAIDLARRGVSFRLIEKMESSFRGSRGKGLQPRTLEVFEDLGMVDRIVAAGGHYPPQRHYQDDGTTTEEIAVEAYAPTPAEPYGTTLMVPQFLTEAVMRQRLAELGYRPGYGCALVSFAQDSSGVTAQLDGKDGVETVRARYLIGADGGRSLVRHALGIGFPGKTLGVRAMVADVSLSGFCREAWHRFNEGSMARQLAICPLVGTDLFQLQAPIPLEGDIDLSCQGLTAMVAARTGRDDAVVSAVSWASAFAMNARLADRYRSDRVFLVGDAAHTHPPTGGQGLNTSVQDAYNLGWKLAAVLSGAPDALLDSYEEERRPIAAEMLGLATRLLEAARQGNTRRGRDVQQLDLGYPTSSLALEKPERTGGVLAGDRAPDASVRGAAGQMTRLFELFKGPHWTAFTYLERVPAGLGRRNLHSHEVSDHGDIQDVGGHFGEAYGVAAGDIVLVRPDGYVGAIVAQDQRDVLETYLALVGLRTPTKSG
jgi:2-polyprenyl-6-methoxyphenol hydroxylase-like FAD-dependent oxidoreductase